MPVTIKSEGIQIKSIGLANEPDQSPLHLLKTACREEIEECQELLQSSFGGPKLQAVISGSSNGFVRGAIKAYNQHHALCIRPEDVWFAILSQLSFFINAHAEELRGQFVAHEGKKELILTYGGNRHTFDFSRFAKDMGELLEQNVVDAELRKWMMPAFTTTTKNDIVVASILLMGVTQHYFSYTCHFMCGLPSVTLLGDKADWELILTRLEKLKEYGEEPTQFYNLLKPVVSRFVGSFDNPESEETIAFWQRIAHRRSFGSGSSICSGWITAFCFWNKHGTSMYRPNPNAAHIDDGSWHKMHVLKLDDAVYHPIDSDKIPPGYSTVPVKVNDNGYEFQAKMIAGSVGMGYTSSQGAGHDLDTVQPESGWCMYQKKKVADGAFPRRS